MANRYPLVLNGSTIQELQSGDAVAGLVIGTDVQAWDADLDTWAGKTAPSGTVVGTTDAQTLTNKTLDGGTVVSAHSSSDALRITQTGAGNALVVEDSTNPDSTPFVVQADGTILSGQTVASAYVSGVNAALQASEATGGFAVGVNRFSADTSGANIVFRKSRATTATGNDVVSSGDTLGIIRFSGTDGTAAIEAARIQSAIDGTPGTNDMPGRLVFSTTADGASSPTERMRIDNAGRVGIGSSSLSGYGVRIEPAVTGNTGINQVRVSGAAQSDVTSSLNYIATSAATAAASFTLPNMRHFLASQGTIGAGSTVTNQFGFSADSNLTGATNNYGFYSNIASGTGRWNFYSAGTAANYFGGDTQFEKAIIEKVFTITDGAAFEIDPSNGTMQLITLGASRTPKATNFAAGESVTLMVDDGSAFTLTWSDSTFGGSGVVWKTNGGVAPTLNTSGYTVITLWKVGSQIYGARVGDA